MRIGLISDIHANLEALEVALSELQEKEVDDILCLGDVVGYGADPNACIKLVRQNCSVSVLGNHDAAVIGAMSLEYYYDAARLAIEWTRRQLTKENLEWLYTRPYTRLYKDTNLGCFHSAPIAPSGFFYVVFKDDAAAHARVEDRLPHICVLGHSHLIKVFHLRDGKVKELDRQEIRLEDTGRYLISIGSVGQPRDKDSRGAYALLDTEKSVISFYRFKYDVATAAKKITSAGLEPRFGERLFVGT